MTLFDKTIQRTNMHEAIDFTIASMNAYAKKYNHWCIAWSGGKDSTATLTLIVYLIESGKIPKPKSLTVLYADTRMELIPLSILSLKNQFQCDIVNIQSKNLKKS
jgi:DNA sulfur modification protein DndC